MAGKLYEPPVAECGTASQMQHDNAAACNRIVENAGQSLKKPKTRSKWLM